MKNNKFDNCIDCAHNKGKYKDSVRCSHPYNKNIFVKMKFKKCPFLYGKETVILADTYSPVKEVKKPPERKTNETCKNCIFFRDRDKYCYQKSNFVVFVESCTKGIFRKPK